MVTRPLKNYGQDIKSLGLHQCTTKGPGIMIVHGLLMIETTWNLDLGCQMTFDYAREYLT